MASFFRFLQPHSQPEKPLILTIHGFGRKCSQEMGPLADHLEAEGYDVIRFDIFDPENEEDTDWNVWLERCEEQMRQARKDGRPIVLIGFSMGGVIASWLASLYDVQQLILCAPAFNPLDWSKVEQAGKGLLSSSSGSAPMSMVQKQAFLSLVSSCKNAIQSVDCPILILHGTADEVIPPRSSEKAWKLISHPNKRLLYLQDARHRFLYDGQQEKTAFALIDAMLENRLI